jgi:molybdate transport system substrate-binding protein
LDNLALHIALAKDSTRVTRIAARLATVLLMVLLGARLAAAEQITVFAAASLKDALDYATIVFQQYSGAEVRISYAASSALAKRIEAGAPSDIFFCADRYWMDYLQQRNLIERDTRKNLLGNRLVLVAPITSDIEIEIKPKFPLASLLEDGRLAVADPDEVPAGKYAKAALEKLGVWSSVENSLMRAENVRAALYRVSRLEAPLGIVYQTDAESDKRVKIVGVFPEDTHPPIVYPIALTNRSNAGAGRFLGFLESSMARTVFERYGFVMLP